jgi:diguanylate cyclase (GGDEF)-like protein
MAASDPQRRTVNPSSESASESPSGWRPQIDCLSGPALAERLDEEISRAGRHGTPLSCLLISIENPPEFASLHGSELSEQALAYAGPTLMRELRRFDRVGRPSDSELLVVLPGADGPRGEIVARRVIDRLRAIKIESDGVRRSLRVSVGLAAWREDLSAEQLLAQTRAAARHGRDELVSRGTVGGT